MTERHFTRMIQEEALPLWEMPGFPDAERIARYLTARHGAAGAQRAVTRCALPHSNPSFWHRVRAEISSAKKARRNESAKSTGAGRIVATNVTTVSRLAVPPDMSSYEEALSFWYEADFVPLYGEEKGRKKARQQAEKQIAAHEFLTQLMAKFVGPGERVVSVGSGFCHENAVAPQFDWICLEYQENISDLANQRNRILGISGESRTWSAFPGDVSQCQDQSCKHLLPSLGPLPRTTAVYAKHFCGGGVDSVLYTATRNRVPVIVANTCCAYRYVGLSHAILAPEWPFEEYRQLAFRSQNRTSADGQEAVEEIDDMREAFLRHSGYVVYRGWMKDRQGKRLPAGSWIIAVLPSRSLRR